jgi:hypothetical protein
MKGRHHRHKGHRLSAETRKRISERLKGRHHKHIIRRHRSKRRHYHLKHRRHARRKVHRKHYHLKHKRHYRHPIHRRKGYHLKHRRRSTHHRSGSRSRHPRSLTARMRRVHHARRPNLRRGHRVPGAVRAHKFRSMRPGLRHHKTTHAVHHRTRSTRRGVHGAMPAYRPRKVRGGGILGQRRDLSARIRRRRRLG